MVFFVVRYKSIFKDEIHPGNFSIPVFDKIDFHIINVPDFSVCSGIKQLTVFKTYQAVIIIAASEAGIAALAPAE